MQKKKGGGGRKIHLPFPKRFHKNYCQQFNDLASAFCICMLLRISANTVLKHVCVFRKPAYGCFTVSSCTIYFDKLLESQVSLTRQQ